MSLRAEKERQQRIRLLAVIAVGLVLAWQTTIGSLILYPLTLLATWFHEMGHGLTAMLLGQHFEQLMIFPNGSGVAESQVSGEASRFTHAAFAAGGPIAPSAVGALLIVASAHPKAWRPVLWLSAAVILGSVLIWVRSLTGLWVLPLVAGILGLIAWRASPGFARFSLQFLGVLGAMSMLRDFNYLFTEQGMVDGQPMISDTGQIEAALGLPHWFWAGLILLISGVMVGAALKYALADHRLRPPPRKLPANVLQFKRDPKR